MTDEFKFNIGDTAVAKILELREQEPGEKDYALFLQIDGVQGLSLIHISEPTRPS